MDITFETNPDPEEWNHVLDAEQHAFCERHHDSHAGAPLIFLYDLSSCNYEKVGSVLCRLDSGLACRFVLSFAPADLCSGEVRCGTGSDDDCVWCLRVGC